MKTIQRNRSISTEAQRSMHVHTYAANMIGAEGKVGGPQASEMVMTCVMLNKSNRQCRPVHVYHIRSWQHWQ